MTTMITPRAPRDGDRSRTAVLPASCRAIGAQLGAARETRQLSIEDVASKLLLSRGQILGLERAQPAAFYTTGFFLRGLRKYMTFMDLPAELLVEDVEGEEDGLRLTLADLRPARDRSALLLSRAMTGAAAAAALVIAVGAGGYLIRTAWSEATTVEGDTLSLSAESLLPSQPIQLPVVASRSVQAQPASSALAAGDPDAAVRVSVGKATWVFIRYPDNRVIERRLAAGEELEVGPLPVFLAVGTADSVEVRVENRPVALGPYIRNGQVRMTQPDLAKLVP
jgi:cytoskeleton protein RodZ